MEKLPLVSVVMITYGHEMFIEEAINSVLMQECDFNIELIVANDASPDNTDFVIQNILKSHHRASIIHYIKHDKNMGMMPNFIFSLQQSKSKYIALCEGDDYWTDLLKLQKQVDFLKNNPDFGICFHRANLLQKGTLNLHQIPKEFENKSFDYIELLKHYNFITTASVVFRKPESFCFPNWFLNLPFGDMGLYKLVSKSRKIYCLPEIMSVYRIHDNGIWSGIKQIESKKVYLNFYRIIYQALNKEEKKVIKNKISLIKVEIANLKFPKNGILSKIYSTYLLLKF